MVVFLLLMLFFVLYDEVFSEICVILCRWMIELFVLVWIIIFLNCFIVERCFCVVIGIVILSFFIGCCLSILVVDLWFWFFKVFCKFCIVSLKLVNLFGFV